MYSLGYLGLAMRVMHPACRSTSLVTPPPPRETMVCSSSIMQMLYRLSVPGRHQPTFSKEPDMYFCR